MFTAWPKTPRYKDVPFCIITEKIDGTNGCVIVKDNEVVGAQSRNRMLIAKKDGDKEWQRYGDNMGFGEWVINNSSYLANLGNGYHYGEWAGPGIQKNPHKFEEKRFFLFDVLRYENHPYVTEPCPPEEAWSCIFKWDWFYHGTNCSVVDELYRGPIYNDVVYDIMSQLKNKASDYGYEPEGIIIHYPQFNHREKLTFRNQEGKWKKDENSI